MASKTGKPVTVEVDHRNGDGAGCQVDVFSRPDGEISGIVINPRGVGVPGFVTVEPVNPKEAQVAMKRGGLPGGEPLTGIRGSEQCISGGY